MLTIDANLFFDNNSERRCSPAQPKTKWNQ